MWYQFEDIAPYPSTLSLLYLKANEEEIIATVFRCLSASKNNCSVLNGVSAGVSAPSDFTQPVKQAPTPSTTRELDIILRELRAITDAIKSEQENTSVKNDWKFAAMVLDRVCLLGFTLFTVVATLALFGTAPHVLVS